jgi:hypothetical protein
VRINEAAGLLYSAFMRIELTESETLRAQR